MAVNIGDVLTYNYTGWAQLLDLALPLSGWVTASFTIKGSAGGDDCGWRGGGGCTITGSIRLPFHQYWVYIGGNSEVSPGSRNFNGGGAGFRSSYWGRIGATGGAASDIRSTYGWWSDMSSLKSRIIVAAGGGGGALDGGIGGNGGFFYGGSGTRRSNNIIPSGGSQTSGGNIGGSFGSGGTGSYTSESSGWIDKGGAGSGWYGGGIADARAGANTACSGAGGSSFVYGWSSMGKPYPIVLGLNQEPIVEWCSYQQGGNSGIGQLVLTITNIQYRGYLVNDGGAMSRFTGNYWQRF